MGKIYVTSDTHFNHNKDFIYAARGFSSVEEMNDTIIKNWNSVVTDEDTVYMLGDVVMGENLEEGLKLVSQLKGKKFLAFGNHDTEARIEAFEKNGIFQDIQMGYRIKYNKRIYVLTHYPTVTANGEDTRVINLYGHTHQTDNFFEGRVYMYHIGMDSHNCTPVLIDDILPEIKANLN